MADRPLKLHRLRQILKRYGVTEDSSRGKGSHTMFFRTLPEGVFSFPIPTNKEDIYSNYIRSLRKKFRLTELDGVTDYDFYEG
jgi:hypothetical protein